MITKFREWSERNPGMMMGISIVGLLLASYFIYSQIFGNGSGLYNSRNIDYYDVVTGETFTASSLLFPPIKSPDGNEGVRIRYYICPYGKNEKFVGFYEKFNPDAKKKLENLKPENEDDMDAIRLANSSSRSGMMLISTNGKKWVPMTSREGTQLIETNLKCKDGSFAKSYKQE